MVHTIAHIEPDEFIRKVYADLFGESGITIQSFPDASSSLEAVTSRQFQAIVLNPDLSPGENCRDQEIAKLADSDGRKPALRTFQIGLYLIRKIRNAASPNRNTPLLVDSIYDPEIDRYFTDARQRVLEAGADKYFYRIGSGKGIGDVHDEIKRILEIKT